MLSCLVSARVRGFLVQPSPHPLDSGKKLAGEQLQRRRVAVRPAAVGDVLFISLLLAFLLLGVDDIAPRGYMRLNGLKIVFYRACDDCLLPRVQASPDLAPFFSARGTLLLCAVTPVNA